MKAWGRFVNRIGGLGKMRSEGQGGIVIALGLLLITVLVLTVLPVLSSLDTGTAIAKLDSEGYAVFAAGEYDTLSATVNSSYADTGSSIVGRAITSTLHVSPDGDDSDGLTWDGAYTTIQGALDVASTDTDDCTLILVSPHTTYYDIDTAGDPTWSANVVLQGPPRDWAAVMNTHATATSILKLTGKASVSDLTFDLGAGSSDGLVLTDDRFYVSRCMFVGRNLTGAATALWLDGTSIEHGEVLDTDFIGHIANMTGIVVDAITHSRFEQVRIHECAVAIQIVDASSDDNDFNHLDIGDNVLGFDIDVGNRQHISHVEFHGNTANVDDEVGDHVWKDILGEFEITIEPSDLTGTTVSTHANANTWGADTELRAAVTSTVPFRVVGAHTGPDAAGWFSVRFSLDGGVTFYDTLLFNTTKREGVAAPAGTEFVFNEGTRISASAKSDSGNDNVQVWLEIQEI